VGCDTGAVLWVVINASEENCGYSESAGSTTHGATQCHQLNLQHTEDLGLIRRMFGSESLESKTSFMVSKHQALIQIVKLSLQSQ
jgi:hypothetical protein